MTNLTPRVVKVAVMPKHEQDVLDLMNFTRGFKVYNPEQEFVTMSMGKLGRLSRFAGDLVGSSWTFASLDNASAPGQISLADMRRIMEVLSSIPFHHSFIIWPSKRHKLMVFMWPGRFQSQT